MVRLALLLTLLLLALAAAMVRLPEVDTNSRGVFFTEYRPCSGKRGKLKRTVNKTVAHRDHVHIGMTKRGAAARTSFWSRGR